MENSNVVDKGIERISKKFDIPIDQLNVWWSRLSEATNMPEEFRMYLFEGMIIKSKEISDSID